LSQPGRLAGKTALITGGARGQGRSHALRLAEEGANIVAVDIADQIDTVPFPMGTREDLAETGRLVQKLGVSVRTEKLDVRDPEALAALVAEIESIDIVVANAGIVSQEVAWKYPQRQWQDTIDVNLTGTWNTLQATVPSMIEKRTKGSIIVISSVCGVRAQNNIAAYTVSKHGLIGMVRSFALELAPYGIRVNAVNPGNVDTPMINNQPIYRLLRPDLENPGREEAAEAFRSMNLMDVPWVDARDISNAVLWLASEEARYVTGTSITVDAGLLLA
jgi:SDR family mycofactocin-dependent oxidoreductase